MKQYRPLETPKLYAIVKEEEIDDDGNLSDGSLADPITSIEIIIENPVGEVIQILTSMNKTDTGKYYYDGYTLASDAMLGQYKYGVRAIDEAKTKIANGYFEVVRGVS